MSSLLIPDSRGFKPKVGDLVRYASGSTALAILESPHAGGWHGRQCMGGLLFVSHAVPADDADRRTWVACAQWRKETPEKAAGDIGLSLEPGDVAATPPEPPKPQKVRQRHFTDTPRAEHADPRNGPVPVRDDGHVLVFHLLGSQLKEVENGEQFVLVNRSRFNRWRLEMFGYALIGMVLSGTVGALVTVFVLAH